MALIQKIPGVSFSDSSLPKLYVDPMLNKGSLYLVEPMHPYEPWAAGVPSVNAILPNIAASNAAALAGGTEAEMRPTFFAGGEMRGTTGLLERTAVGGLHGITTQAAPNNINMSAAVNLPAKLKTYLYNNRTHTLYFSLWHRITRTVDSAQTRASFAVFSESDANWLAIMSPLGESPAASPKRAGHSTTNQGAVGNSFRALGTAGPTEGFGTLQAVGTARPWSIGRNDDYSFAQGSINKYSPSHILYRAYAEDLTVSGRTFAQAAAADKAAYEAEVLRPGGRYYGDSFTNPTLIP